jgi:hypothetical protein
MFCISHSTDKRFTFIHIGWIWIIIDHRFNEREK